MSCREGCAAISDTFGNLIFYTSGNMAILDSVKFIPYQGYGLAFSPDNSKLYAMLQDYSQLVQYALSAYPNIAAVKNSRLKIFGTDYLTLFGMRTGPDNKIDLADFSEGYVLPAYRSRAPIFTSCYRTPN